MNFKTLLTLLIASLSLAACGTSLPQPGGWTSAPTDLGVIGFLVNEESNAIVDTSWVGDNSWACGEADRFIGYTGHDQVYAISDGAFEIILKVIVGESVFDLKTGQLVIAGEFDAADRASGTWTFTPPSGMGDPCTGNWDAAPSE